jgi:hypothetical protein
MKPTKDQNLALIEVRRALYERLSSFSFTEEMLQHRSVFHLLNLLQLLTGHRNYLGQFTHTCWTLEQIFGIDGIRNDPTPPEKEVEPEPVPEKVLVN